MPHPKTSEWKPFMCSLHSCSGHWRGGCSCMNWCGVQGILHSPYFFFSSLSHCGGREENKVAGNHSGKASQILPKQLLNFSHRREGGYSFSYLPFYTPPWAKSALYRADHRGGMTRVSSRRVRVRGMDRMTSQCCYPPCNLESIVSKPVSPFVSNSGLGS